MRNSIIPALILAVVLFMPMSASTPDMHPWTPSGSSPFSPETGLTSASAGGSGTPSSAVLFMSREISGLSLGIYNSYSDLSHEFELDLSSYLVSGWTLSKVTLDVSTMTAAPERETMGITPSTSLSPNVAITNSSGLVTDFLYQEFYNLAYDGKLENYSLTYKAPYYDITLGDAFLVVRSNYSDPLTNMTGWIAPWIQNPVTNQVATHDCSSDNAVLSANTYYYVVIDGGALIGASGVFNHIIWGAEATLGLETGYRIREDGWYEYVGVTPREADIKYTYTPWNTTSGSAMLFSDPQQVELRGNSTQLAGTTWNFESGLNITQVVLTSNQSLDIDYTLRLEYTKNGTPATSWYVPNSGNQVKWNSSLITTYPTLPNLVQKGINITVQPDWTPSGLYNSTYPGNDYAHYSKSDSVVVCTDVDNETWTLVCNAPNYVTSLALSDYETGYPIVNLAANTIDVDVEAAIQDGLSNPVTGGLTNLTIQDSLGTIYAPSEAPAVGGSVSFVWDISATTSGNGTHTLEVYWTNGTEAGYRVLEVFVYHSTTLVPSTSQIEAYANQADSIYVTVSFEGVFPSQGLDDSLADVTYSFESVVNASMLNPTGGQWEATISTLGMTNGTYSLYIYAEGYALENRSIVIPVHLTYQTQTLAVAWSNTNNISYLESTTLIIDYNTTSGGIPDAVVNVTFQGSTHTMVWDPVNEYYWIELTGSNFTGVPGTFWLNVSAWRLGYEPQYDDTIQITVRTQTGLFFDVDWTPSRINLTFIDQLEIRVRYEYGSNPILSATVRATFNGSSPVDLIYNGTSQMWEITLLCSDYLGSWEIAVYASADGYMTAQEMHLWTINEDIASLAPSWEDFSATTDYATAAPLTVTLLDSLGNPINDATISLSVFGATSNMTFLANGVYTIQIAPETNPGVFLVQVILAEYGFTADTLWLDLTVQATTTLEVTHLLSEYEQWNLTISASYRDSVHDTPITNAVVNVTIGGTTYTLTDMGGYYAVEIVLDLALGSYTIYCSASEALAVAASSETAFTVLAKERLDLVIGFGGNLVAGQLIEVRATLTSNETGLPISNALVTFEVSIRFRNGTIAQLVEGTMSDLTNNEGVASIGIRVPEGNVESLSVQAIYEGSRTRWAASASRITEVQVNILSLLLAFFVSDVGIIVVGSIVILGIVASAYNKAVKPRKKAAKMSLENQLQKFRDLQTIQHFMAVYVDRGTCVFYHPFRDERIEPDLISGFISAITSVYGEIKGDGVRGTLEEIQYHGLRLNSYSGEFIIGILILEGEMTRLLRERLQFFVELFENQYEHELDRWNGIIDCFDSEWVVSTLNSAFNYSWHLPHRFGPTQKVSKTDARILDYIGAVRDENGEFYLRDLLKPLSEMLDKSEAETLDRLLSLQEWGAIVPLGVQTILQRQGMGLADREDLSDVTLIEMPDVLETEEPAEPAEEPVQQDEPQVQAEPTSEAVAPAEEERAEEEHTIDETIVMVEREPAEEPEDKEVSTEEEPDSLETFVSDVETLLEDDSEPDKEPEDDLDKFVKDVESLLSKDKEEPED